MASSHGTPPNAMMTRKAATLGPGSAKSAMRGNGYWFSWNQPLLPEPVGPGRRSVRSCTSSKGVNVLGRSASVFLDVRNVLNRRNTDAVRRAMDHLNRLLALEGFRVELKGIEPQIGHPVIIPSYDNNNLCKNGRNEYGIPPDEPEKEGQDKNPKDISVKDGPNDIYQLNQVVKKIGNTSYNNGNNPP